jgi:hypothetical protein
MENSITPTPFFELTGVSQNIKVNYAYHLGIPKDTIMQRLGITSKLYNDTIWLYHNKDYKTKVEEIIKQQQELKQRVSSNSNTPIPFNELTNCSLTFKINYAHHFGVSKEEIMQKLNVTAKYVYDKIWFYYNIGASYKSPYKEKILNYLQQQQFAISPTI